MLHLELGIVSRGRNVLHTHVHKPYNTVILYKSPCWVTQMFISHIHTPISSCRRNLYPFCIPLIKVNEKLVYYIITLLHPFQSNLLNAKHSPHTCVQDFSKTCFSHYFFPWVQIKNMANSESVSWWLLSATPSEYAISPFHCSEYNLLRKNFCYLLTALFTTICGIHLPLKSPRNLLQMSLRRGRMLIFISSLVNLIPSSSSTAGRVVSTSPTTCTT